MKSLDDLAGEIKKFQEETFPEAKTHGAVAHLLREAVEAYEECFKPSKKTKIALNRLKSLKVECDDQEREANVKKLAGELADVIFMTLQAARLSGEDLHEALSERLERNRARTWKQADAQGAYEHDGGDEE